MVNANLVGDGSAASADASSDDSSLWTTHEATYDCSADRRADDDLGAGVVAMIVCALCRNSSAMTRGVALRESRDGRGQGCGKCEA